MATKGLLRGPEEIFTVIRRIGSSVAGTASACTRTTSKECEEDVGKACRHPTPSVLRNTQAIARHKNTNTWHAAGSEAAYLLSITSAMVRATFVMRGSYRISSSGFQHKLPIRGISCHLKWQAEDNQGTRTLRVRT